VSSEELRTLEVLEWQGITALCDCRSVCSQKVLATLLIKRVPFSFKLVDIKERQNRSLWFMGVNPRGVIPALVHDGRVYVESVEIAKYMYD
jgi:glutathione S-transferase